MRKSRGGTVWSLTLPHGETRPAYRPLSLDKEEAHATAPAARANALLSCSACGGWLARARRRSSARGWCCVRCRSRPVQGFSGGLCKGDVRNNDAQGFDRVRRGRGTHLKVRDVEHERVEVRQRLRPGGADVSAHLVPRVRVPIHHHTAVRAVALSRQHPPPGEPVPNPRTKPSAVLPRPALRR